MFPFAFTHSFGELKRWNRVEILFFFFLTTTLIFAPSMNNVGAFFALFLWYFRPRSTKYHFARTATANYGFYGLAPRLIHLSLIRLSILCVWLRRLRLRLRTTLKTTPRVNNVSSEGDIISPANERHTMAMAVMATIVIPSIVIIPRSRM